MKLNCSQIAPLLFRVAQHEATPEESLQVARHVEGCTGCRIRLARERHLETLLESEVEALPVDERFVDRVMAALPNDPPPQRPKRPRRGLKLAIWVAAIGSALGAAAPQLAFGSAPRGGWLATGWSIDRSLPVENLTQLLTATIQALQGAASWIATAGSLPTLGGVFAALTAMLLLTLVLGGSAAVGLAGHYAWSQRA